MSARRDPATRDLIATLQDLYTAMVNIALENVYARRFSHDRVAELERPFLPRIEEALRNGADPDVPYSKERTHPVIFAARNRLILTLGTLLRSGAAPDVRDHEDCTALARVCITMWQSPAENMRMARMLLDAGANPNVVARWGSETSPLTVHAATHCHIDLVRLLVERGAAAAPQSQNEPSALVRIAQHASSWFGDAGSRAIPYEVLFEFVDFMVSRMPLCSAKENINSAFRATVASGNVLLARHLKERHGAEINAAHPYAWAPIHQLPRCYAGDADNSFGDEMLALLLQWGADLEARTPDGKTVLHLAAAKGKVGLVRRLLDAGADLDARFSDSQQGVFDLARRAKSPELLALLRAARARRTLSQKSSKARTAWTKDRSGTPAKGP